MEKRRWRRREQRRKVRKREDAPPCALLNSTSFSRVPWMDMGSFHVREEEKKKKKRGKKEKKGTRKEEEQK